MLFSCTEELPIISQLDADGDFPTMTVENLQSTYTENGRIKGKLQAAIAKNYDGAIEPYIEFPNGITIVLYKENKIETSMIANSAIYYQSKKSWEATGDVIISNINGDIMKTQKLYGDEKDKKIFTNEFVQITKADSSIINSKAGFESNTEFTIYKFLNVDGKIYYRDEFSPKDTDSQPIETEKRENEPKRFLPNRKDKPNNKPDK